MSDAAIAQPGIGHNRPPTRLEAMKQRLKEETAFLWKRLDDLRVGLARVPEKIDASNESVATDFVAQVKKALKEAEKKRKEIVDPINEEKNAVQAHFKTITEQMEDALKPVTERLAAWQKEKDRILKEDAERRRREAEEAEAKARQEAEEARRAAEEIARKAQTDTERQAAANLFAREREATERAEQATQTSQEATRAATRTTRLRGDYGSVGFVRESWDFEIVDINAIPAAVLWRYLDRESIEKAIRAAMRAGVTEIRGVKINPKSSLIVK